MKDKLWLSSPHMGGEEQKYIQQAFDTNWIAPLGPNVVGFEDDLKTFLKEDIHVAALSSGTAALHLALILLGVSHGDEVICQSLTFSASANPIVYLGATPVFIDSETETWNMSPKYLEEAIVASLSNGKKPKAIIPVHLYGMPAKMTEIISIARKYEIPIIEDAAEALGSTQNGQQCGTFGDMACLSFNGNKIITTSGGGALISKKKAYIDKAVFLATQARDKADHYEHSEIGYNYRMSNILAGLGRGQMQVLTKRIKQRRENYFFYKENLSDIKSISFLEEPADAFSNHWLTTILIDPLRNYKRITKETLRLELEKNNIESRPIWKPMHMQPIFKNSPYFGDGVSDKLFECGLCLPSGSNLNKPDLQRVVNIIRSLF